MRRFRFGLLVVAGCVCAVASRAQEGAVYGSWRQAQDAFNAGTDNAVRAEAYQWMTQRAAGCPAADVWDVFNALGRMARALGREGEFEAACAARMGEPPRETRNAVAGVLSDWHVDGGRFEAGLKVMMDCLGDAGDTAPAQLAWLARKASAILAEKLSRHGEASGVLAETLEKARGDAGAFASLANAQVPLLLALSDAAAAEARCREVLALGGRCPAQAYAAAAGQLSAIAQENGDAAAAAEALMLLARHESWPQQGLARRLVELNAPAAALAECAMLYRRRVISGPAARDVPDFQSRVERAAPELVELLLALGRKEEALGECRAFVFAAADRNYAQAVELSARTLKACDGNLGRANAFLAFQQADGAAVAGLGNALMDAPLLRDAARTDALAGFGEGPAPADWNGWLMRSAQLLWLDRPAAAMDAAAAAFAACPLSEAALQTCASAVARPLLVASRDASAARGVLDYLLWGASGPDGKALADPFPEARGRLPDGHAGAEAE